MNSFFKRSCSTSFFAIAAFLGVLTLSACGKTEEEKAPATKAPQTEVKPPETKTEAKPVVPPQPPSSQAQPAQVQPQANAPSATGQPVAVSAEKKTFEANVTQQVNAIDSMMIKLDKEIRDQREPAKAVLQTRFVNMQATRKRFENELLTFKDPKNQNWQPQQKKLSDDLSGLKDELQDFSEQIAAMKTIDEDLRKLSEEIATATQELAKGGTPDEATKSRIQALTDKLKKLQELASRGYSATKGKWKEIASSVSTASRNLRMDIAGVASRERFEELAIKQLQEFDSVLSNLDKDLPSVPANQRPLMLRDLNQAKQDRDILRTSYERLRSTPDDKWTEQRNNYQKEVDVFQDKLAALAAREKAGTPARTSEGAPAGSPVEAQAIPAFQASQELLESDVLRLILFSAVLSSRVGDLIEPSEAVNTRWNNLRALTFAGVPIALVTGGTLSAARHYDEIKLGIQVAKTDMLTRIEAREGVENMRRRAVPFVNWIGRVVAQTQATSWRAVEIARLDRAFAYSGQLSRQGYEAMRPLMENFVTKTFARLSLGVLGTTAVLSSSYASFNPTASDALSVGGARAVLGYNEEMRDRVDRITNEISAIFLMEPEKRAQLKETLFNLNDAQKREIFKAGLYENLQETARRKDYERDTVKAGRSYKKEKEELAEKKKTTGEFDVDLLQIMARKELITPEQAVAANALKRLVSQAMTSDLREIKDRASLIENADFIVAICSSLEQMIASGKLSVEDEKQVRLMIGNATTNLKLVKSNLQNLQTPTAISQH